MTQDVKELDDNAVIQVIANDVADLLRKYKGRSAGVLADGVTGALMLWMPPSTAIQALAAVIGKA